MTVSDKGSQIPTASSKDDASVFFPDNQFKLSSGETIEIPKISWRKEVKLIRLFAGVLKNLIPHMQEGGLDSGKAMQAILDVVDTAPDQVTQAVACILNKDKELDWVEDNLVAEDIVGILIPFFKRLARGFSKLGKLADIPELKPLISQVSSTSSEESSAGPSSK